MVVVSPATVEVGPEPAVVEVERVVVVVDAVVVGASVVVVANVVVVDVLVDAAVVDVVDSASGVELICSIWSSPEYTVTRSPWRTAVVAVESGTAEVSATTAPPSWSATVSSPLVQPTRVAPTKIIPRPNRVGLDL